MTNREKNIDVYFVISLLLMMLSIVAIVVGVLIGETYLLVFGIVWLIISSLRLIMVLNVNQENERRPLLSSV
jgi:hypothetical protein